MSFTLQDISDHIIPVPNFKGVMFRNMSKLLLNIKLFDYAIDQMVQIIKKAGLVPNYLAGFESRGFLFTALASKLGCGFIMIRKPNSLPQSVTVVYTKEYDKETEHKLTISECVPKGSKILLIDDLVATGGTIYGGCQLVMAIQCKVIGSINLLELCGLITDQRLIDLKIPILSLLKYHHDEPSTILNPNLNCMLTIKQYIPMINPSKMPTIVFCHPSLESLAENYINANPDSRKGVINWEIFPDTQPNITFESMDQLENKKIVFFLSTFDTALLFKQLSMLMVLPRQFIRSLDIYITYFSVGTMERVDTEGILATAETMARMISCCVESTQHEKPIIHIWDIHALPIRFYFNPDNIIVRLHSGIQMLLQRINPNCVIVFPDDGAFKRFKTFFTGFKIIVCTKVRVGNERVITIIDKLNFPKDETDMEYDEIIIVDDLVQSGMTLIKCKIALEQLDYKRVSAYVTHSVFPNDGWIKMINVGWHNFYTTNSVPEVTDQLPVKPFVILPIFEQYAYGVVPLIIYVASHNEQKLRAVYDAFVDSYDINNHMRNTVIVKGINVSSNVHEQPINEEETKIGCENRLHALKDYLERNNVKFSYAISLENGLYETSKDIWEDKCCMNMICMNTKPQLSVQTIDESMSVFVPTKYVQICLEKSQNVTIGQVIQEQTGIPKNEWHQRYNDHGYTRVDIMKNQIVCRILNLPLVFASKN
jgi:adenine phosphoribosyltransferase